MRWCRSGRTATRCRRGDALAELRRCAGTQFQPEVVEAFFRLAPTPDQTLVQVAEPGRAIRGGVEVGFPALYWA